MVVSDTADVPGPQKERGEFDEGEQLTALVKSGVRDLSHICCKTKSAGVNHYSALENQRKVLVRPTFLISSTCCTIIWRVQKSHFLYPHMFIFEALKKYLLLIIWIPNFGG